MAYSTFSIGLKLSSQSANTELPIIVPPEGSTYLQSLRLKIACPSLPESDIPNIEPELTRQERIKIIRDLEWGSPRKELALYQKSGSVSVEIARVSCLNRPPYYSVNLLQFLTDAPDLPIGSDGGLTCRVRDVGFGLLSGSDELVIHGAGVTESIETTTPGEPPGSDPPFGTPPSLTGCTNALISVSSIPIRIAPVQSGRSYLAISLQPGSDPTWIGLDSEPSVGSGIYLTGEAASYELNNYSGEIFAISSGQSFVTLTLCG